TFQKEEFAGFVHDAASYFADPDRLASRRHDTIVYVPVAASRERGIDRVVDVGEIIRMDDGDIVANSVVGELIGRMAADGEHSLADVEHSVVGVVAAAIEEAIHPAGNAEKRVEAHAIGSSVVDDNYRRLIVLQRYTHSRQAHECP